MAEQVDIIEEMARDPGTRPICKELSPGQLKALRTGRINKVTARALEARRLLCHGSIEQGRFAPTPMGAQWRQALVEGDRMRRALQRAREMLRDGAERNDVLEVIVGGLG